MIIDLIEALFGTWITVILSIILILFWFMVALIPRYLAIELSKVCKTRIPLIILGILLTGVYYIYFPWGIFDESYKLHIYRGQEIDIAATGWIDTDDLSKSEMSFLYYQPRIIIASDRLFAYYRFVKAYEPRDEEFAIAALRVVGLLLGRPAILIHVVIYKLLGCLIAVLLMVWAPSLSFTVGCFNSRQ